MRIPILFNMYFSIATSTTTDNTNPIMNTVWVFLLATTAVYAVDDQARLFSWSTNSEQASQVNHQYHIEANGGNENYNQYSQQQQHQQQQQQYSQNDTAPYTADDLIESILASNRQGRNLDGFDEVYSDPTVQDALQKGDDSQARNLIKDKLCTLGLMQCDGLGEGASGSDIGHKNAFLRPGELIYAQPPPNGAYHIGSNGPYRGGPPNGGFNKPPTKIIYGAPRPMPPVFVKQPQTFGPPRKVGYGPIYSSPPQFIGSSPSSGFSSPVYHSKPPGPIIDSPPYKFDSHNGEHILTNEEFHALGLDSDHHVPVKSAVNDGITGSASNSVNIHHHYHHLDQHDSAKAPAVIVNNPIPVPVPSAPLVTGEYHGGLAGNGGFNSLSSNYQSGFKGQQSGFNGINPSGQYGGGSKPIFESVGNYDGSGPGASGFGTSGFGSVNSLGGGGGSFHSSNPDYYKKALKGGSGINSLNSYGNGGGSSYGGIYSAGSNYQESARQDNFDCVCVPYDQCPARDILGRKGDLILPLDPRNLGSDIEAYSEESNSTSNSTVKRVPKEANEPSIDEEADDDTPVEIETTKQDVKKVSKREVAGQKSDELQKADGEARQSFNSIPQQCGPQQVCCRRPVRQPSFAQPGQCGRRNTNGITGRIKNPVYVDGDSEFGEYPWQVAILKKDPKESVYVCGGTLIDGSNILTAAHCVKTYSGFDLRVRLGEWDVNHDVEFFPYIERDVQSVHVHPEYYAGTLDNDLAILKLAVPVDFQNNPHISPACLPDRYSDFSGQRCWTTGWGKDAFGDFGKYQNILKEVDVPIIGHQQCEQQLRNTRLGYTYQLNPGFICAGGEEGKDACKGDGGGPMVCERNGAWQLVGVVSWGIGCGQVNVPGVYVKVSHYLDWIQQTTQTRF
ncbi:uncharacterized protein LOC129577895 isoform X2 [Sitodiplosis mosellana]|uniref:uncharacterized protein LOC129577895 isoform X2 n=1 Tax=Sitodiplosis mosellana TaxID=263140 RepID=UPI00244387DD|nr:uncharacterized protein LOC129577895 isoform X2 [Sitodiplosis mosellana]